MPVVLNISKKSEDNIRTYIAIANILRHNQEVNKDRYARRELKSLQLVYERKLDNLIKNHKAYKNKILVVEDGRYSEIQWTNFNSMVSKWFDTLYNKTPIIHNELINRNSPSNSATVGLKKLLYSLVKNPNKDVFGIDTSGPERSIYMNIFSQTNIHGKLGDKYAFFAPKVHGLDSLWNKWDELLHTTIGHNTRIAFSELENLATLPPWGIKRGLAKILLIVKIFMLSDRLSLYKYKSNIGQYIFLPRMYNDTIDLLIRRPDLFYVKYVETKGIHQNLYSKLHAILVGETVKENATLLDAVKPLMEFTNRLSAHTKNTNRVGPTGKKVIGVILKAVSPEDLVYKELPEVLGMKPIYDNINSEIVDDYLKRIENVYYKIRECEDTLNDEIILRLIKFWNLKENSTLESLKNQLQQQFSKDVVSLITDYRLKIFSERILDNNRTGIEWLESISSHIVGKMPNNWLDSDFLSFTDQLQLMYLQVAEIKILAKRKVALEKKNEYPGKIEKELISYINDLNVPKEEIESALFNLLSRLDEEYQKKN